MAVGNDWQSVDLATRLAKASSRARLVRLASIVHEAHKFVGALACDLLGRRAFGSALEKIICHVDIVPHALRLALDASMNIGYLLSVLVYFEYSREIFSTHIAARSTNVDMLEVVACCHEAKRGYVAQWFTSL